jgi:hypothetical protein
MAHSRRFRDTISKFDLLGWFGYAIKKTDIPLLLLAHKESDMTPFLNRALHLPFGYLSCIQQRTNQEIHDVNSVAHPVKDTESSEKSGLFQEHDGIIYESFCIAFVVRMSSLMCECL